MRLAVSLVCWNDAGLTARMLGSLHGSDITAHRPQLFVWDNGDQQPYRPNPHYPDATVVRAAGPNEGCTRPRIAIFEAAQRAGYTHLVEVHQDMIFAAGRPWFGPLLTAMRQLGAALVWPAILLGEFVDDEAELCRQIDQQPYRGQPADPAAVQANPWLLDVARIQAAIGGWYDPAFYPAGCEDDDVVYRLRQAGQVCAAVPASVVNHEGAHHSRRTHKARRGIHRIFEHKHGLTVQAAIWQGRRHYGFRTCDAGQIFVG